MFLVTFIVLPVGLRASMVFSEIMYDLSGADTNEWIEVENSGSNQIDFSLWKLFEANSNHGLNLISGNAVIGAGEFAIIANDSAAFISEFPSFSGNLFDSSFSLSNTGETLVLRDETLSDKDTVSYDSGMGATEDGNSLQNLNSSWTPAFPTPGVKNSDTGNSQESQEPVAEESNSLGSSNKSLSTSVSPEKKVNNSATPALIVSIGKDQLTAIGNPVEFMADVRAATPLARKIIYRWSFGDGSTGAGQKVTYNYPYPGDYVAVLDVSRGSDKATARVNVKVIEPNLVFKALSSGVIQIENKGKEDVNLSFWKIESSDKSFVFPENTIVKATSLISVPPEVSNLNVNPTNLIYVFNPLNVRYISSDQKQGENLGQVAIIDKTPRINAEQTKTNPKEILNKENSIDISSENLTASAANFFEVEKPPSLWNRLKKFFTGIFR